MIDFFLFRLNVDPLVVERRKREMEHELDNYMRTLRPSTHVAPATPDNNKMKQTKHFDKGMFFGGPAVIDTPKTRQECFIPSSPATPNMNSFRGTSPRVNTAASMLFTGGPRTPRITSNGMVTLVPAKCIS